MLDHAFRDVTGVALLTTYDIHATFVPVAMAGKTSHWQHEKLTEVRLCEQFSAAAAASRGEEKFDSETLPKRWTATARLQARLTVLQHQLQQQEQQLNLFTSAAAGSGSKKVAGLPSLKASCVLSVQRQPVNSCAFHPLLPQLLAGADDGNIRVRREAYYALNMYFHSHPALYRAFLVYHPVADCPLPCRSYPWKEAAVLPSPARLGLTMPRLRV